MVKQYTSVVWRSKCHATTCTIPLGIVLTTGRKYVFLPVNLRDHRYQAFGSGCCYFISARGGLQSPTRDVSAWNVSDKPFKLMMKTEGSHVIVWESTVHGYLQFVARFFGRIRKSDGSSSWSMEGELAIGLSFTVRNATDEVVTSNLCSVRVWCLIRDRVGYSMALPLTQFCRSSTIYNFVQLHRF
ncbi:hypothetical protein EVAR_96775_1 [Eumeta japonica]|uniref:Uncharacterized protein n=1 Tax=Eumeta variegata TaxID=151549 RepID=A0A4C1WR55_EUMVA|nr:hypothetical protein EVAR_96775_1 [Eumeta japonica]